MRNFRRRIGFTLVELLVVTGVIAVLVAMLLPALNQARYQAHVVACGAQLRQVGNSILLYANDWKGAVPGKMTYLVQETYVFINDPAVPDAYDPFPLTNAPHPCLINGLYPRYVRDKHVFFDPGLNLLDPGFPNFNAENYCPTPWGQGNAFTSYTWLGGWNLRSDALWAFMYQHNVVSLNRHLHWGGQSPTPPLQMVYEPIRDPSNVSPLTCWAQGYGFVYFQPTWLTVAHYKQRPAGEIPGMNCWFMDGHVEWRSGAGGVSSANGALFYGWQGYYGEWLVRGP